MGLWPFSSSGAKAEPLPQSQAQQPPSTPTAMTESLPLPDTQQLSEPPQSTATQPPPVEAPHDPDFYAAHPHLAPPSFSTSTSNSSSQTANSLPTSTNDDDELDPFLPRTMSCRAAFDSAFYCSSLGGHFNDIYRYGQLRNCSEHWNDFWFCMRVKNSYSPVEIKQRMVQERYREKEEKFRTGPSSEDVWRMRGPGEEVRGAFGMGGKDDGGEGGK